METNKSSIIAYMNNKDIITIKTNNSCEVFTINGITLYTTLIRTEDTINVYKAKYPIEFNKEYEIKDSLNNSTYLIKNLVVKESFFDEMFYYDKDDLGPSYSPSKTTFKVWAPIASKVKLKYILDNKEYIKEMIYDGKGVYKITIKGNLNKALYCYLITNNNVEKEVNDIYAYSCNENFKYSAVIDLKKLEKVKQYKLDKLESINEAIIYETSIRDFTSKYESRPTFKTFTNEYITKNNNDAGFNYLKNLNVTHIQLMPINNIATIDEVNSNKTYNWGYDTLAYNVLEGSYSSNPSDPYCRMNECIDMINKLHSINKKVTVDFVFNHTYLFKNSIYNNLVPNYFYLMDEDGNLSNGSFCGNDLDLNKKMVVKYILDMVKRYVNVYNIDGIRLDLMGILTIDSVNKLYNEIKKIKSHFIIYGEGWNMPSMLESQKRATLANAYQLPNISFFNDCFRDSIKGSNLSEGFISGNISNFYKVKQSILGSCETGCYFNNSLQSINYIDCHDNYTLFDKLSLINANDKYINKKTLLSLALIIFSYGVSFIHSGMEFNRSKNGVENSYNSGDSINNIDWDLIDKYKENIKALNDFISIKKSFKGFYLSNKKDILKNTDIYLYENKVLVETIAYSGTVYVLVYNPNDYTTTLSFNSEYYHVANEYGYIKNDEFIETYKIKPFSFNIFRK